MDKVSKKLLAHVISRMEYGIFSFTPENLVPLSMDEAFALSHLLDRMKEDGVFQFSLVENYDGSKTVVYKAVKEIEISIR